MKLLPLCFLLFVLIMADTSAAAAAAATPTASAAPTQSPLTGQLGYSKDDLRLGLFQADGSLKLLPFYAQLDRIERVIGRSVNTELIELDSKDEQLKLRRVIEAKNREISDLRQELSDVFDSFKAQAGVIARLTRELAEAKK